jgi:hypothetical protein
MVKLTTKSFRISNTNWPKREFDPHSAEDLKLYREFLLNDKWGDNCPFVVEWPFNDVLATINHKIMFQHIDSLISKSKKTKAKA